MTVDSFGSLLKAARAADLEILPFLAIRSLLGNSNRGVGGFSLGISPPRHASYPFMPVGDKKKTEITVHQFL